MCRYLHENTHTYIGELLFFPVPSSRPRTWLKKGESLAPLRMPNLFHWRRLRAQSKVWRQLSSRHISIKTQTRAWALSDFSFHSTRVNCIILSKKRTRAIQLKMKIQQLFFLFESEKLTLHCSSACTSFLMKNNNLHFFSFFLFIHTSDERERGKNMMETCSSRLVLVERRHGNSSTASTLSLLSIYFLKMPQNKENSNNSP